PNAAVRTHSWSASTTCWTVSHCPSPEHGLCPRPPHRVPWPGPGAGSVAGGSHPDGGKSRLDVGRRAYERGQVPSLLDAGRLVYVHHVSGGVVCPLDVVA